MKLSITTKGAAVFKNVDPLIFGENKFKAVMKIIISIMTAIMLCLSNAIADDLMAGGQETVTGTFGADSSIAKWIILAEVIVGIISYIKTKNMFLLFGIAVVIVYTSIGFGLVG